MLTIAHRLDTIIDSDEVIVMKDGECVDKGPPFSLLVCHEDDQEITASTYFAAMVSKWLH